jgi:peptidylprolyl isomerase domain and WD repeat-containing protein 1
MTRKYDESLEAIQEMQQAGTAAYKVEDMEFGRRLAVERELEMPGPDGQVHGRWSNAIWDETGSFILYPSLLGIKGKSAPLLLPQRFAEFDTVLNVVTNRVVRVLGKDEAVRFLNLSLYQGAPSKTGFTTMVRPGVRFSPFGSTQQLIGYGCFSQPHPCEQRAERPNTVLHRL